MFLTIKDYAKASKRFAMGKRHGKHGRAPERSDDDYMRGYKKGLRLRFKKCADCGTGLQRSGQCKNKNCKQHYRY